MLLKIAQKMRKNENEGFIIRTQAPFASKKALQKEADYLKSLYKETLEKAKNAKVGDLLYRDSDLPVRVMRDSIGDDVTAMTVGDKVLYEKLLELSRLRGDFQPKKIVYFEGETAMFRRFGIDKLLYGAVQPSVALKGGGYLVIQQTEAMTVVDVNTGSYVGDTSMEETAFSVNMAAAKEVARQVRLRNVGGIVVVDFIDMEQPEHKQAVTDALSKALENDKAKCKVLPMSDLCLTEFTRKRQGSEVPSYLFKPCEHCASRGFVQADVFVTSQIRADIMDVFSNGCDSAVVELNEGLMKKILCEGWLSEEASGVWKHKLVYFIPHKTYADAQFSVRGERSKVLVLPDKAQMLY